MNDAWHELKRAVHRAAKSGRVPFGEALIRAVRQFRKRGPDFGVCALATLSRDPRVFYTLSSSAPIGLATAFGARYGNTPAAFMIGFSQSREDAAAAARVAAAAGAHRKTYPDHLLVFTCNAPDEANLLRGNAQTAVLLNHNIGVSEAVFRPLPDAVVEFDAVLNAQLIPFKRHHLAVGIDSVAHITYARRTDPRPEEKRQWLADILALNPAHTMINRIDQEDGLPVFLSPAETNAALNRAAVGLCLSAVEGANYASMEYMLAGLPVVSTPSLGGRDVYFDPDYVLICEPDPRAVRDAVAALKARNIPRDYIRARTLAKIEPDRRKFLDIADDFIETLGGRRRYDGPWPFSDFSPFAMWKPIEAHMLDLERGETRPADQLVRTQT